MKFPRTSVLSKRNVARPSPVRACTRCVVHWDDPTQRKCPKCGLNDNQRRQRDGADFKIIEDELRSKVK